MNFYRMDLHKFILGEHRTDGWKSQWRIDLERRMAEDASKPRPYVKREQIVARQIKPRGPHNSTPRECEVCGSGIRQDNLTGRCNQHKPFKQPAPRAICPYTGCGRKINHKNLYGICHEHFTQFRGLLKQTEVRICVHKGCFNVLLKNCHLANCRKHAKAEQREIESARMRRSRALKRAA